MRFITALLSGAFLMFAQPTGQTPVHFNKADSSPHGQAVQAKLPEKKLQVKTQEKAPTEPQPISPEPTPTETPAPEVSEPTPTQAPVAQPIENQTPVLSSSTDMMSAAGIPTSDWAAVDYIVSRESGWNTNAVNPNSGSCGLVQELPCGKSGCTFGDGVCQLRWATSYAIGRYGSWWSAQAFWKLNQWW